jgi:hypothetical protein
MIFYYVVILCITSIIDCADPNKIKTPERATRIQETMPQSKKLQDKEEKRRMQDKKKSQKTDMKHSLRSLTGSYEDVNEALDRLMT